MQNFALSFTDQNYQKIIDTLCAGIPYPATVESVDGEIPNPETREVFAKKFLKQQILRIVNDIALDLERRKIPATFSPIS